MKEFRALDLGNKEIKFCREGKKIRLRYFTRKEFTKLEEDTHVIGYTSLKVQGKKEEPVGKLYLGDSMLAPVYEKKRKGTIIKGYVPVGKTNYIAIDRYNWLPFLLLLLLIILLCFLPFTKRSNTDNPTPPSPWIPTIEKNIVAEESLPEMQQPVISIDGFSDWTVKSGETENLPIILSNPEGNPCYFSFELGLSTGEVLYQSDMVPPGEKIKRINLSRPLDQGEYVAYLRIKTNEVNTGVEMNGSQFSFLLSAK